MVTMEGEELGFASLTKDSLRLVDYILSKGHPLPPLITNTTLEDAAERIQALE